ncbi:BTAD domain-containing putative transcriptional regulator [Aquihabitans daechungensis]|uniref:BTAD domain-containing putative transcriptional regulator n=1 Tax=Aquihabitans daechungensis TaxID=1052257 RepID=UPI003B9F1A5E
MTAGGEPTLRVFGGVSASGRRGPVDLGGPKQRAVLALLLVDPQVVVSVDRIIDSIWGEDAPGRAEVSVRGYISNLRKALAEALDGEAAIEFRDRGYVLVCDPDCIDLHRFEQAVSEGRSLLRAGDLAGARDLLAGALALSSDRPFGALADELHLDQVIARIDQRRGEAAELLTQVRLDLGEHDTLGPDLLGLVARYPYREGLRVQLATALYRSGDQVRALRSIEDARRMLIDDVGVDPGPELRAVEAAILAHDPALAWTAPPASAQGRAASVDGASPSPSERKGPELFGRARELAAIVAPLRRLPVGGTVVVSGEAGIGKTALLRHLVDEALDAGVAVGWGRCPESASDAPYRSWTMAARQAAARGGPSELVTVLDQADADLSGDPTAGRLVTHLAVADALVGSEVPLVLVIDDLQWADDATLALVEFLASELDTLPVVLAFSVRRSGAGELRPPVRDCLGELARVDGAVHVALEGLTPGSVHEWLATSLGHAPPAGLEDLLTATTDGNPFYVRELLALLDTEGRLGADGGAARPGSVPAAVQDVIRRRTSRQPPATQQLMATAAVIGRRFDLDVLAHVLQLDPAQVLDALAPAVDAGLVEVEDPIAGRYGFSHALVAEALVAEQNPTRLAQRHAQITLALEDLRAGRIEGSLEELAHHACEGASAGTARQAFTYSLAAADAAHAAQASGDEAEHLRRALAVQPPGGDERAAERVGLLIRMGAALRDVGDVLAGRDALVDAALIAEGRNDPDAVAAALALLSPNDLWAAIDWSLSDARAVSLIERVLAAEPAEPTPAGIALKADLSGEVVYVDPVRAAALSAEAVVEAEQHGDPLLIRRVLLQRFWAISSPHLAEERAAIGDRLVELSRSGDLPATFLPLAHLAGVSSVLEWGQVDAAEAMVAAARETAHPARTPVAWMHLLWAELCLSMVRGELDRALVQVDQLGTASWRVRRFTAEFTRAAGASAVLAEQGAIDEALRAFEPLNHPPYDQSSQWLLAWFLASNDRGDEARAALDRWDGPIPDDWLTLTVGTAGVLAAATIGEVAFLRRHLPAFEPLSGFLAVAGNGGPCFGPTDYAIALAKEALGDPAAARAHATAARELAEGAGAVLWLPRIAELQARLG